VFVVYVDVRYETKGMFSLDMLYNSGLHREFIGYVLVPESSTIELLTNSSQLIEVVVLCIIFFCIKTFCNNVYYSADIPVQTLNWS